MGARPGRDLLPWEQTLEGDLLTREQDLEGEPPTGALNGTWKGISSHGSRTWKENLPREQILERDLERDLLLWERAGKHCRNVRAMTVLISTSTVERKTFTVLG